MVDARQVLVRDRPTGNVVVGVEDAQNVARKCRTGDLQLRIDSGATGDSGDSAMSNAIAIRSTVNRRPTPVAGDRTVSPTPMPAW